MDTLLQCMVIELRMRQNEAAEQTIDTIYFGGGTPSLCTGSQIHHLLKNIRASYAVAADCEITLEANPDDITLERAEAWQVAGINRLSIGIQSFHDEDLRWMHRAHSSTQALEAILWAQEAGLRNISADLIFASPSLTQEKLAYTLEILTDSGIPHISCYNLTVEEKTLLDHQIKKGLISPAPDEEAVRQFFYIHDKLTAARYLHYEISNYALPGFESKHNTSYWKRIPYMGIGPSAHSFNGTERSWNVKNNEQYIRSLQQQVRPFEMELLDAKDCFNEILFTGLRTARGADTALLTKDYPELWQSIQPEIQKLMAKQKLVQNESFLQVPLKHWTMADSIASDLFVTAD